MITSTRCQTLQQKLLDQNYISVKDKNQRGVKKIMENFEDNILTE